MLNVKEAPWKVILVSILVNIGMAALINLVLVPKSVFDSLENATSNLISISLQANLLNLLMFILIVFVWGKLRPADVGLEWRKIPQGLLFTALLWLAMQAIILLIGWMNGDIHLHPGLSKYGLTAIIGNIIGQFAGTAFFEEAQARGFYLRQFYLKIKIQNERARWAWALLSMAGLFALFHIPNRIYNGLALSDIPFDLIFLLLSALFLALIYVVSGNLFFAIGVHALMNQPILITETTFPTILFVPLFGLLLAALSRARKRQTAQVTLSHP
jgi:membrane protease YdiL (CAAX protease family)